MKPRYRLEGLDMDEVSFVDMGDDPEAKICLFKRAGEQTVLDGDVVGFSDDDDGLCVTTETGKVYQVDESSTVEEDGEEWLVVEKATLLYDDNEPEDSDEPDASDNLGGLQKLWARFVGAATAMVEDDQAGVLADMDKGKFAQTMQMQMADRAYEELSAMCSALKGAIDADLWGGGDASQMNDSVDEFAEAIKNAISNKWTQGELLGKAADEELVSLGKKRDREVLGLVESSAESSTESPTVEGGASVGVSTGVGKSEVDQANEGGGQVAGMDRSQMSPGQIAYQDALESGQTPEEAAAAQARVERDNPPPAETAEPAPEQGAAEGGTAEGVEPGEAAAASIDQPEPTMTGTAPVGTSPDDITGDDGTHHSPFEKMLKGVPEPIAKAMRSMHAEIQQYAAREEEQTYITKARGFSHIPVNPVELGPVMQRIAKGRTTEADETYVMGVLRSAEEMAKQGSGLFRPIGVGAGAGSRGVEGSAVAEVEKLAKKVASEQGISEEVAFAKVRQDPANEALVSRYNEEVQG